MTKPTLDPNRPVGHESSKSYAQKVANGFFDKFCSGSAILEIGFKGYFGSAVPIVPQAIGVDLDYPGYDGKVLPFPDESQDAVYTSHCLEHIPDWRQAIREWFRVLKRGGFLIIVVPHQFLYERRSHPPSRWNPDHKRFYTPAGLLREIEEALDPNSYRVRHLADNDLDFDYTLSPMQGSVGCQEIELVIEKISAPFWSLDTGLYAAAEFSSSLARRDPWTIETDFSTSDACVVYGPYIYLPTGRQVATFHFEAIGLANAELASPMAFDVAANTRSIAIEQLQGAEGAAILKRGTLELPFNNLSPDSVIEFRVYTFGRPYEGKFVFRGTSVKRQ